MCPAVTSVSLLASAISLPALIAAIVGLMPIIPTTAVRTISAVLITAVSIRPSIPVTILTSVSLTFIFNSSAFFSLYTHTTCGLNSLICFSNISMLLPAARLTTFKSSFALTISRVCVPIEPVEPRTAIFFILILISKHLSLFC